MDIKKELLKELNVEFKSLITTNSHNMKKVFNSLPNDFTAEDVLEKIDLEILFLVKQCYLGLVDCINQDLNELDDIEIFCNLDNRLSLYVDFIRDDVEGFPYYDIYNNTVGFMNELIETLKEKE